MKRNPAAAIWLAAILSFASWNSFGAERAELFRTDGEPGGFGDSLVIQGNNIVVGGSGGPSETPQNGAAFVYSRNPGTGEWTGIMLSASDGEFGDRFGEVVAIEGNLVVVGAPNATINGLPGAGAVYVFKGEAGAWQEIAKLHASDPEAGAMFGADVAINGRRIIAGAPQAGSHSPGRGGAAYLFGYETNVGWHQEKKLVPHDDVQGATFAHSVAIAGDFAAVGRYGADTVYLYQYDGAGWRKIDILRPRFVNEPGRISGAGWDMAMDGHTLAISAPEDLPPDAPESYWLSGVVHVYEYAKGSWVSTAALSLPFDPTTAFGAALALNDGYIAVTAWREGSGGGVYEKNDAGDWSRVVFMPKRDINEILPVAVSRDFLAFPIWPLVDDHPCVVVHDLPLLKTEGVPPDFLAECTPPVDDDSIDIGDDDTSQQNESENNPDSTNTQNPQASYDAVNMRSGGGALPPLLVLLLPLLFLRNRYRRREWPAHREENRRRTLLA